MKIFTLLFFLVFSHQIVAQKALEISKPGSENVKIFEENKRVKVKTLEGKKYIGRFHIIDGQNIDIEGNTIPLNQIKNIKSRSVVAGIAGTALIIYGAVVVGTGIIVGLTFGTDHVLPIAILMGGTILTSGIFFNEFAKNHRNTTWSYKIIDQ